MVLTAEDWEPGVKCQEIGDRVWLLVMNHYSPDMSTGHQLTNKHEFFSNLY